MISSITTGCPVSASAPCCRTAPLPFTTMHPPTTGNDWIGLSGAPLPTEDATAWVVRPDCGAVVVFLGTVRDHAEGRPGVVSLDYEAYVEQAEPRMAAVAAEARTRFPGVGRIVLLH